MHQFYVSVLNESGSRKSAEVLANEICNTFYLYSSDDGASIDTTEYNESKAAFLQFAEHLLNNVKSDDPMVMIGMEEMDEDDN